ncbi:MAG TPA: hypothetical protein VFG99_09195, partial [Chloroflexia bacterium]|nr:hypothetical protein [Chloroflexia bacterium]
MHGGEASQALPGAVETFVPPSTMVPDAVATARSLPPTSTPDVSPPPTLPPLPPPPSAASLPVDPAAPAPNVAWSAETDSSLTIWVGRYNDDPAPGIKGVRAGARWDNKRLGLASMAASPDGRS